MLIGVDPHKDSHTAALDEHGRLLDQQRVPATHAGYQRLLEWADRWPQRCWAVEGFATQPVVLDCGPRAVSGGGQQPPWT